MGFKHRAAPLIFGLGFLASPTLAQHLSPCPYLIETVAARALKISDAQSRVLDLIAKDADALGHPRARACAAARDVIAQSDELGKFAEKRRERCESEKERAALDAAVALGSASAARGLATRFCGG